MRRFGQASILVATTLGLAACPGTLANPERFTTRSEAGTGFDGAMFLRTTCGIEFCHGSMNNNLGLDLASEGVAERIKTGRAMKMSCDMPLYDMENVDSSYFFLVLSEDTPPCGTPRMPQGSPLPAETVEQLKSWLEAQ